MYQVNPHRVENSIWKAFIRSEEVGATLSKHPPERFAISFLENLEDTVKAEFYFEAPHLDQVFTVVVRIRETGEVLFQESFNYATYEEAQGLSLIQLLSKVIHSKPEVQARVERFRLNQKHQSVLNPVEFEEAL